MKKVCFAAMLPVIMMMVIAACGGAPKSQGAGSSAQEPPVLVAVSELEPPVLIAVSELEPPVLIAVSELEPPVLVVAPEPEPPVLTVVPEPEPPVLIAVSELEPEPPVLVVVPEPEPEPPVLTVVPEPEPEPPVLTVVPEPEPEPPVLTVVPEPEPEPPVLVVVPEPEPEPPVLTVVPEPEPEPPVLTVVPEPEPEPPVLVVAPEPEPVNPSVEPPPMAAPAIPVAPPLTASPPTEEEKDPPVIVREPLPRIIPELPNPASGIRERQDGDMVFSRVVRAAVGQQVVIPFRGTGWVYLGEAGAKRGILYYSRRLEPEGQSFIFTIESAGEYALKFYRQDFIRDFILNDYVQVIAGVPSEIAGIGWFSPLIDQGRVIAEPRWPTSLAEAQAFRAGTHSSKPDVPVTAGDGVTGNSEFTEPATPPATPPSPPVTASSGNNTVVLPQSPATPATQASPNAVTELPSVQVPMDIDLETYVKKAKEEFDAGRVASAISLLDQLCQRYPAGSDEVWWLYGQFYEGNSPSRNILTALDCYRRLIEEYPQSSRYDDARRRIAYLQRYYINIH